MNLQTAPTRLRQTNSKYENSTNGYSTFLNEKAELPRLSILDNYKQIMRIMTNSYIKGGEYQNKFKNRMEKDIIHDDEYLKIKEEQLNTMKMSTILKSLNAPFRRSKNMGQSGSLSQHGANQVHGASAGSGIGTGRPGMQRYNSSTKSSLNQKFIDQNPAATGGASSAAQPSTTVANTNTNAAATTHDLNTDLQNNHNEDGQVQQDQV